MDKILGMIMANGKPRFTNYQNISVGSFTAIDNSKYGKLTVFEKIDGKMVYHGIP